MSPVPAGARRELSVALGLRMFQKISYKVGLRMFQKCQQIFMGVMMMICGVHDGDDDAYFD